jgi:hypothetical protein
MTGSSTLNMYRRFGLWWFTNANWNMLYIKLRSITTELLKGRPEHSSALGPKRGNDTDPHMGPRIMHGVPIKHVIKLDDNTDIPDDKVLVVSNEILND